ASSSGRMLEGCPFPVSVCIAASASGMNTISRPIGSWTFALSGFCPLIQNAVFRYVSPEDCAGAWDYLKRLDWHRSHLPIDELHVMAEAMRRFLDSDGDRHAIGD